MNDPLLTERGPGLLGRLIVVAMLFPAALIAYRFRFRECWEDGWNLVLDPETTWDD